MKNKKGLALLLSATLLFTTAMPGTLAISSSTASSATTLTTASAPDAAPTPDVTAAPDTTPDVTATPDATTTPDATVAPDSTAAPDTTASSDATAPDATTAPDTTAAPDATATPDATSAPEGTAAPDATVAPDSTAAPENDTTPAPDRTFDVAAAYEYVMGLASDEEVDTYLASLTEDEYAALEAYAVEKEQENAPVIESKVFTDAGPFLPAVNVGSQIIKPRRAARTLAAAEEPARVDNDGIITSKTVTPQKDENGNTTYTLRLESYVTGTTTTTTTTTSIPVDIVLVLDQSGSMAYNFNGNSTSTNSERRQYALKEAVNNFIDEVAGKYSADCDNRMAIVTYGTNAAIMNEWTVVDENGAESLKNGVSEAPDVIDGINKLPDRPSGATNTAAGVQMAEVLLSDPSKSVNVNTVNEDKDTTEEIPCDGRYTYDGANKSRQKVVIVFTDGIPTTSTEFSTEVADSAIISAKNLKDSGVTVYSIGIFQGVKPDQMYGDNGFTVNADGTERGTEPLPKWGSTWGSVSWVWNSDIRNIDIPAGNRFLNLLSSNFKNATEIGLNSFNGTILFVGIYGYTITKNFDRTASNYYLTASDSDSLKKIFTTISQNIQTGSASVQLGSETKVQDVISDYFELPAGANPSSISVKTAPYTSEGGWGVETVDSTLIPTISEDGKTVTVTGFDFSQNYCDTTRGRVDGNNDEEGNFYGRKLIIEIPIKVREGFLGGNDVPTNTTGSAIIAVGDNGTTQVMEQFEVPTTNVPIAQPTANANTVTIYEGGSVNVADLYTTPTYIGEDDWKDDYVTISATVNSTEVSEGKVTPSQCSTYPVTFTYAPLYTKFTAKDDSTPQTAKTSDPAVATVHVLKPTVTATVNDVQKYYGETYTLGDGTNGSINVTWTDKNNHADIPYAAGTAPYTAGSLELAYTNDSFTGTIGKTPFDVGVSVVKKETKDAVTATITTNCQYGCTGSETDGKYTVHVNTCQLTITKTGGADGEPYVFKVYKGTGENKQLYTEASVTGNDSVTIYELPVGTYSIVEDDKWSWRYTANNGESVRLTVLNPNGNIECKNMKTKDFWLNGFSSIVKNTFGEANKTIS